MLKHYIVVLFAVLVCTFGWGQNIDKEVVALQMNSCVMSLTNLNESQSLATYEKERENLINNLSKEGMAKLPEITDLRESILSTIYQLEITQEEREVLKKIKAIDAEGEKWRAISNGLNQAMVFIPGRSGGGVQQAAFYALLTAARSAVDYGASIKEAESEEAKVLWEIRKQDLKQYAWLNTEAYKKINEIFRLYKLDDSYELTPRQASEFNKLITDTDPARRSQKLINNANLFKYLNEYNYYLGMAFLQQDDFDKADPCFKTYIENARKSRIYKIDDKLGCIYLARLAYDNTLSRNTTEQYISEALRNLPHNGAAYIQCATIYCTRLNDKEKAFNLLRNALYDDMMTDKEAIIMTITEWLPLIKTSPSYEAIYNTIAQSIEANVNYISLNSFLHFLIASSDDRSWSEIEKLISIEGIDGQIKPKGPFAIKLAQNLSFQKDHFEVFWETKKKDEFRVDELMPHYTPGYKQAQLEKKFSLFKSSPDLIFLFFDYNKDGNVFYVKKSLSTEDFNKLTKAPYEFDGLKSFSFDLTDKSSPDRKALQKIVVFCRKNQTKTPLETILFCKVKKNKVHIKEIKPYIDNCFQGHSRLSSIPVILPPIDTGKVQYTYTLRLNQQEGSAYHSEIARHFEDSHIRLFIKGVNSDDITLLYLLTDKGAHLQAISNGGDMVFRDSVLIQQSEDKPINASKVKDGKKKMGDVTEDTGSNKSFANWWNSIFKKKNPKKDDGSLDKPKAEKRVKADKEKGDTEPKRSKGWWNSIFKKKDKS